MTTAIAVAVAPGTGRIARRSQVLLFDPTGDNAELIASFDAADDDEAAITAVKQHLIDADFQVAPVVVVDWRNEGVGLIVFGDADVHSSASAAPMISGAGSGTWIERHLGGLELGDAEEAHVWCGDETDTETDLRLGVVRGGGIRVCVDRSLQSNEAAAEPMEIPAVDPEAQNPRPVPAPAPATAAVVAEPVAPAAPAAPARQPVASNGSAAPAQSVAAAGFVAAPSALEWTDTEPKPDAVAAGVALKEPVDPFAEGVVELDASQDAALEDSLTEAAGAVSGVDQDADQAVEASSAGLVEASMCANGHSNPPRSAICRTCAVEMDPDAEVTLIAQPSVGHLRFANGHVAEIDKALVIGRKPAADPPATHPVLIDHAEVSRSHVQISLEGWAVLTTDLGSRNGTWVIPPSDPTPIKLDANVPYLLEHGTTVHLGGPEASFTYDFGTD